MQGNPVARELQVLESKLKAQLKVKHPDEKIVKPLRQELQDKYLRLIVSECALAAQLGVEANLWKLCFYKKIDEFRRVQAKGLEQLQDPAKCAAAEQVLAASWRSFGSFLDKSTSIYLALLQKAALACSLVLPGYERAPDAAWPECLKTEVDPSNLSVASRDALAGTCFRCLIYLGDLERYRGTCLHEMSTYDWSLAEQHYWTAALLRPDTGNPHNQCGVISNYHGDDLSGFYHYSRSVLCSEPYLPQGRSNLEMLCRKNRDALLADTVPSNSQQRKQFAKDPALVRIRMGRLFVRPLGLMILVSNLEHVTASAELVFSRLPSVLDADRHPSLLCLRMVCACIFTVFDLERQMREANGVVRSGNEAQNGNKPADIALIREAYQLALEFSLRVGLIIMRSAKSEHHHLQAVSVLCVWLQKHTHLVAPQKDVASVFYDCERLRRTQESFAEGLADLVTLLRLDHKTACALAEQDAPPGRRPAGAALLPEDFLLLGWRPFLGGSDSWHNVDGGLGSLVNVDTERNPDVLLRCRVEHVLCLVRLLSQHPGPLLFFDSSKGEPRVEEGRGKRARSKASKAGVSSLTAVQSVQFDRHGGAPAGVKQSCANGDMEDVHEARGAAGASVACGECGASGQRGRVDEYDGLFYCDACWDKLEMKDGEGSGGEHEDFTASGSLQQDRADMPTGLECLTAAGDQEGRLEADDEAFGAASLAVGNTAGLAGELDDLAQQTALFAASFQAWRPPLSAAIPGVASDSAEQQCRGCDEADDNQHQQLEHGALDSNPGLLSQCTRYGAACLGADDGEEEEEHIVFQPRSNLELSNSLGLSANPSAVSPAASAMQPIAQGASLSTAGSIGISLSAEARTDYQSPWGGFGTGMCGFGPTGAIIGGSESIWSSDGAVGNLAAPEMSRFRTRNPFAS